MKIFYENKTKDFSCGDSRRYSPQRRLEFPSHLHHHIELIMMKGGRSQFTVDSCVYDVKAGDIIVIYPNQIHSIKTLEQEEYVIMIINPDYISEFSKQFNSLVPVSNLIEGGAFDGELSALSEMILSSYFSKEPFRDTILRGYLLAFLGKLLPRITVKDAEAKGYDVLGTILNYCASNSHKPLSLDVLEKDLHISKYYISHTMSARLHIGFNDYINSIRVSNACKYLQKTDMTITEISDAVGFNTMRTFNRAFLKHMGMTPREYRIKK